MSKEEMMQRLEAVCKTLDGGITVSGVQNAANLAGCYSVVHEVLAVLNTVSFCEVSQEEEKDR